MSEAMANLGATWPRDEQIAEWVKDTCLLFGVDPATAYEAAGIFVVALRAHAHSDGYGSPT